MHGTAHIEYHRNDQNRDEEDVCMSRFSGKCYSKGQDAMLMRNCIHLNFPFLFIFHQ